MNEEYDEKIDNCMEICANVSTHYCMNCKWYNDTNKVVFFKPKRVDKE